MAFYVILRVIVHADFFLFDLLVCLNHVLSESDDSGIRFIIRETAHNISVPRILTINLPLLSVGAGDNHFLTGKSITRTLQGVGHENKNF